MILATICCRGGSKGVLNKNIILLNGIPLLVHTIRQALESQLIDDLIISTDDERIAEIARDAGAKVPFKRPTELASDTSSKWPVFTHALEFYEQANGRQVDYLVDLDVTVPLKTSKDIDGAIQLALDNLAAEVVITGYEPERNPYFNMMEVREDGLAEIVKTSNTPIVRRQDAPQVYSLSPAAFVIKKTALYNFPHWSKAPCKIYPMPRERAIDIDSPLDFELVEFLMKKNEGSI
jgi:N-acylneuraminate cytidylyltransferase/CMP-N,N'-diacetyllegionaminic acid synthase